MPDNFVSRNHVPLPLEECKIKAIVYDYKGDATIYTCLWKPFNPSNYPPNRMPSKGYLGTASVIEGDATGIGFHCWEQNNSEFLYYSLIQD